MGRGVGAAGKNFRILLFPAKLSPRHDNEFLHVGPSVYIFNSKFTFQRWVLIPLEILLKMSKISGIGQKLFRWKKGEKTPKNEWPELVGKVWLRFSLSCSWEHNCNEKYAVFFQGSNHLYHLSTKDLVASNKWIFYLRSRKAVVSMIDWPYLGNKSLLKLREIGKQFYRRLIDRL